MGGLPCCRRIGVAAPREELSGGGSVRRCCRAVSWGKRVRFVFRAGANGGFGGVLSSGMIIPRGTLARTLPQRARARSPHTIVAGPFPLSPPFCRPPCGLPRKSRLRPCRRSKHDRASPDCSLPLDALRAFSRDGCAVRLQPAAGCAYHAACESKAHAIILRSHAPLRLAHRLPLDVERLLAGFQAFGFKGVLGSVAVASVANGFRCSIRVHNGRTTTSRK